MTDIVERLRDVAFRGPMQHLRKWDDLDAMHDAAAAEIERLRAALRDIAMWNCLEWDTAQTRGMKARALQALQQDAGDE